MLLHVRSQYLPGRATAFFREEISSIEHACQKLVGHMSARRFGATGIRSSGQRQEIHPQDWKGAVLCHLTGRLTKGRTIWIEIQIPSWVVVQPSDNKLPRVSGAWQGVKGRSTRWSAELNTACAFARQVRMARDEAATLRDNKKAIRLRAGLSLFLQTAAQLGMALRRDDKPTGERLSGALAHAGEEIDPRTCERAIAIVFRVDKQRVFTHEDVSLLSVSV